MISLRHKPRDPHAHVLRAPGRRLLQAIPLGFVRTRAAGGSRRSVSAALSLVSFIDCLVVTVIFLLTTFDASAGCPTKEVQVPRVIHADAMIDAPMVTVDGNQVLVDGASAGNTRSVEELGRPQKIEELFAILEAKRKLWKQLQPRDPFPGTC